MTAILLPSLLLLLALASAALPAAHAGRNIKPASMLQESSAEGQGEWASSQLFGHQPVQIQSVASASADATATASDGLSQAAASATASSQSGGLSEAIAKATASATSMTGTTTGTADADANSRTGSWLDRLGGGFWSRSNGSTANHDRGSSSGYDSGNSMGSMGGSPFGSAAGGSMEGSTGSAGASAFSSASAGAGASGSGNSTDTGVCKDALARHNEYRARHNAAPLTWSTTIAASAQAWSDRCVFEHSNGQYGENLAMGYSTCAQAVDAWYAERSSYSGSFSMSAGHFTQVVWKGSKELGCGYNAGCKMVTCQYSPAGNVMGAFAANVDP